MTIEAITIDLPTGNITIEKLTGLISESLCPIPEVDSIHWVGAFSEKWIPIIIAIPARVNIPRPGYRIPKSIYPTNRANLSNINHAETIPRKDFVYSVQPLNDGDKAYLRGLWEGLPNSKDGEPEQGLENIMDYEPFIKAFENATDKPAWGLSKNLESLRQTKYSERHEIAKLHDKEIREQIDSGKISGLNNIHLKTDYGFLASLLIFSEAEKYLTSIGLDVGQCAETPALVVGLDDGTPSSEPIRYEVLASRTELIDAFSQYGVEQKIFRALKDRPGLHAAYRVKGNAQKGSRAEPMFCPFVVMNWLVTKGIKEKKHLESYMGWHILETKFPCAYAENSIGDPRKLLTG